jgi:hypothetical protein
MKSNPVKISNPFTGLRAFEEEYEDFFFGREKQVNELFDKLYLNNFIAVLGYSGSGKSSLVKCGLLPKLRNREEKSWRIVQFRPGNNPILNMAKSFIKPDDPHPLFDLKKDNKEDVIEDMEGFVHSLLDRSTIGLSEAVSYSNLEEDENLLILVDQFEELFSFWKSENHLEGARSHSELFVELLLAASQKAGSRIYIIITMRSEFLGDCARFQGLPEIINNGQYLIPPMNREELKAVIIGPVKKFNEINGKSVNLSRAFVSRVLNEIPNDQDQLPILQHALMRTWEQRTPHSDPDIIKIEHYEKVGGIASALNNHADDIYEEKLKELESVGAYTQVSSICERLFRALTEKNAEGQEIRKPTLLPDLSGILDSRSEDVEQVIQVFNENGSFLVTYEAKNEATGETGLMVDISHESLIRKWDRLKKWVDEEAKSAETYKQLCKDAHSKRAGDDEFVTGFKLLQAEAWLNDEKPNVNWAKRYDEYLFGALALQGDSISENDNDTGDQGNDEHGKFMSISLFPGVRDYILSSRQEVDRKEAADQKKQLTKERTRKVLWTVSLLGTLILAIVFLVLWNDANFSKSMAEVSEEEVKIANKSLTESLKDADSLKNVAERQREEAELHRGEAENQRNEAENQRNEAERQKGEAERQRGEAELQRGEAERQRGEAERQKGWLTSNVKKLNFNAINQIRLKIWLIK